MLLLPFSDLLVVVAASLCFAVLLLACCTGKKNEPATNGAGNGQPMGELNVVGNNRASHADAVGTLRESRTLREHGEVTPVEVGFDLQFEQDDGPNGMMGSIANSNQDEYGAMPLGSSYAETAADNTEQIDYAHLADSEGSEIPPPPPVDEFAPPPAANFSPPGQPGDGPVYSPSPPKIASTKGYSVLRPKADQYGPTKPPPPKPSVPARPQPGPAGFAPPKPSIPARPQPGPAGFAQSSKPAPKGMIRASDMLKPRMRPTEGASPMLPRLGDAPQAAPSLTRLDSPLLPRRPVEFNNSPAMPRNNNMVSVAQMSVSPGSGGSPVTNGGNLLVGSPENASEDGYSCIPAPGESAEAFYEEGDYGPRLHVRNPKA